SPFAPVTSRGHMRSEADADGPSFSAPAGESAPAQAMPGGGDGARSATMPSWSTEILPIAALLALMALIVARLPRVDFGHSASFMARRRLNWLPVGLTYAFLYMARYNLNVCKNALGDRMTKDDFGLIFFWGALVYGVSFVVNGPLTDRLGGRR